MKKLSRFQKMYLVIFSILLDSMVVFSQFPVKIPKITGGGSPFEKESPITTSLADALTEIPFLDDFEPQDVAPLSLFRRGSDNGFLIQNPGTFMFSAQSYCFRAGTHSPGKGKGYLYAPLKGTSAEIIRNLLRRSVSYPNVPQHDVQVLIWAIIAQTKPSKMNAEINRTARVLLTKEEINHLEGNAFEEISQGIFSKALGKLPPQTQKVFEAERQLRNAMRGNASYGELERIAVLTGEPLPGKDDRLVPSGRWSYHPDGYFIRYYPEGYQTTQIDVYFPENITVDRDSGNRITRIGWGNGRSLVVAYDDSIQPLLISRENSFIGYSFKSIALELTIPKYSKMRYKGDLGSTTIAEWKDSGWTFAGALEGKGKVSVDHRFSEASTRYDSAKKQDEELKKLLKNIEKFDKNRKVTAFSPGETANLLGLMQFSEALKDLFISQRVNREDLFFDPVELAQRAWAVEFQALVSSHKLTAKTQNQSMSAFIFGFVPLSADAYSISEFSFAGGVGTPGNTGRQRIGTSDRPTDKDEKCKSEFKDCQTDSGSEYMDCFAACGANMPSKPTLGQLNEARKCFSACESNYSKQNRECSRNAKRCAKN